MYYHLSSLYRLSLLLAFVTALLLTAALPSPASAAATSCHAAPGSDRYTCCDRVLWQEDFESPITTASDPYTQVSDLWQWSITSLMGEDSQGPHSGETFQWRGVFDTAIYNDIGNNQDLYFLTGQVLTRTDYIHFSAIGPPGIAIPSLPYVAPPPHAIYALRFEMVNSLSFRSDTACRGIYPQGPCPGDGATYGLAIDSIAGGEIYIPAQSHDGYVVSIASHPSEGPIPAIGLPVQSRGNLSWFDIGAACDQMTGTDSKCAGLTIHPKIVVANHDGNGWMSGGNGTLKIASARIVGCVPPQGDFYTLAPCRLYDSRGDSGSGTPMFGQLTITAHDRCGIPSTARVVVGNVTVVPAADGYVSMFRSDLAAGGVDASTINFRAGVTRANGYTVELDSAGKMTLRSNNYGTPNVTGHVIVDVTGYYD